MLFRSAAKENIIEKSGAWYAYNGAKIGQGRENAKNYLHEHQEIRDEVEKKVRAHYGLAEGEEEEAKAETKPAEKAPRSGRAAKAEAKLNPLSSEKPAESEGASGSEEGESAL